MGSKLQTPWRRLWSFRLSTSFNLESLSLFRSWIFTSRGTSRTGFGFSSSAVSWWHSADSMDHIPRFPESENGSQGIHVASPTLHVMATGDQELANADSPSVRVLDRFQQRRISTLNMTKYCMANYGNVLGYIGEHMCNPSPLFPGKGSRWWGPVASPGNTRPAWQHLTPFKTSCSSTRRPTRGKSPLHLESRA